MQQENQTLPDAVLKPDRQDIPAPLAQIKIELREGKPVPLPDPFQFTIYLGQLARISHQGAK